MIPYARQSISEDDIRAVVEVLRSDFLTQGPAVPRFEAAVARYCGAPFAVAANSGTSALHIACLALGLGAGDRLWTSANTFVASANCGLYCGARVDFVDIDPGTLNMSVPALAEKLAAAERARELPKVVVPVHFGGLPCDMKEIGELARRYGFRVIEDASHALGADYGGAKIGGCSHSDATVLSFHPVKQITSVEGGMVLTKDAALAEALAQLRSHGITRERRLMRGEPDGPWYYEQLRLGYNYRLTDVHAALGASQLGRLDGFVSRRRELARRYAEALRGLPVEPQAASASGGSSWHLYVVQVAERARVFAALRERGIAANVHYLPVHLQPYYQDLGFRRGDFPRAESYYERAITLPLYPDLTDVQQDSVVAALREAVRA